MNTVTYNLYVDGEKHASETYAMDGDPPDRWLGSVEIDTNLKVPWFHHRVVNVTVEAVFEPPLHVRADW